MNTSLKRPAAEQLLPEEVPLEPKHYQPDTVVYSSETQSLVDQRPLTHGLHGHLDERGYYPPVDMSWDQFNEDVSLLFHMERWINWAIGDLLNYAKGRWPNRYEHFCDQTGKSLQHLYNLSWVSRVFPPETRHFESDGISWSHHLEVAGLPSPQQREEWLQAAIAGSWTRLELRNRRNGTEPTDPFDATSNFVEVPEGMTTHMRQTISKFLSVFSGWSPKVKETIVCPTPWGKITISLDLDSVPVEESTGTGKPVRILTDKPDFPHP